MKQILMLIVLFNLLICPVFSSESKYSNGISRLEREWLHREYSNEDDEIRIGRLEEKVFGTIHDIDLKSRYTNLRDAFDAQQRIKNQHHDSFFGGVPTSVPISVYDLYRGY